ncbi:formate/nitrite transporter family protein [Oerskovia sp. NPDC057915]|uniref:formate/nitrite transporter family protein n=1 Tax=Oerskovia sp. NPDC057915 TaxID=3346280 RepID=UPI0036DA7012
MLSLSENLTEQSRAARAKVEGTRHPWRYLVAAMLAGAYIGVGVVLMVATAGPFLAAGAPAERLVAGGVFAVALTLVVFAGAELSTSAMMILTQGAVTRTIPVRSAVGTLLFCFGGNLLGSMLFGWMVVQSGILHTNAAAGEMIASMLAGKEHETGSQLFFRGVLCNVLVCAAIWACGRLRSEAGKAIIIFWAIFAFISSGFEHVVANMTTFSIGLFSPETLTTWGQFGRNLLFVGLGNVVGGAVVVGLGYAVVSGRRPPVARGVDDAEALATGSVTELDAEGVGAGNVQR